MLLIFTAICARQVDFVYYFYGRKEFSWKRMLSMVIVLNSTLSGERQCKKLFAWCLPLQLCSNECRIRKHRAGLKRKKASHAPHKCFTFNLRLLLCERKCVLSCRSTLRQFIDFIPQRGMRVTSHFTLFFSLNICHLHRFVFDATLYQFSDLVYTGYYTQFRTTNWLYCAGVFPHLTLQHSH